MDPREKADLLPESPGVYLFRDAGGVVLYVGKAGNLRSRVKSYFLESRWMDAKTGSLAREIADLETIVLANEREALALENNLRSRKVSPRLFHAPHQERRLALFRAVFSRGACASHPSFHPQALSRSFLHCRSLAQSPAAVFAVLHRALPRPVR